MRARVRRWTEEVELLQEEMRRVLAFLQWQSDWWKTRGGDLSHVPDDTIRAGMIAYRERQAQLRLDMRERFKSLWRGSDELVKTLAS